MKSSVTIILLIILLAVGVQLYHLYRQNIGLKSEWSKVDSELKNVAKENSTLQADLEYFSNPDNLAKELRGKLNYKSPGEKLIIVLPPKNHPQ